MDLTTLNVFGDISPFQVLQELLGSQTNTRILAKVTKPPQNNPPSGNTTPDDNDQPINTDLQFTADKQPWDRQQSALRKLRHIAEEARTYEEDTGVYILNLGFPLLHIPKGAAGSARRILAPLAFIPVAMTVKAGASPAVELACHYTGEDRVIPNEALLAWIEQQTSQRFDTLFTDDDGAEPWREIQEITHNIAKLLDITPPAWADQFGADNAKVTLTSAPSANDDDKPTFHPSAVLGLFPASKQGLLRDTKDMIAQGIPEGRSTPS